MKWFDIIKATATVSTGPKRNRTITGGSSAGQGVEERRDVSRTQRMQLSNEKTKREIEDAKVRLEDSKRKMEEAARNDPRRDSGAYLQAQKNVQRDEEYLKRAEAQVIGPQNARRKPTQRQQETPNTVATENRVPLPSATENRVPLPDTPLPSKEELTSKVKNVLTRNGPPPRKTETPAPKKLRPYEELNFNGGR